MPQKHSLIFQLIQNKREENIKIHAKYGANNIRIFGSVARGEETDKSNINFLMDIEAEQFLSQILTKGSHYR